MGMLLSDPVESFAAPAGCFASSNAGVVTIGNRRFSRSWRITERGLLPVSILLDGQELLSVRNETAQEEIRSRFQIYGAPLTQTGAPALHAVLELELPAGMTQYHFAVTDAVPAVIVERVAPESGGVSGCRAAGDEPTGLEVDPVAAEEGRKPLSCCESFRAASAHLKLREFLFADQTDRHDNLLRINEYRLATVEKIALRGTLFAVEDPLSGRGIALLKFAPLPERRPMSDPVDFEWDAETFALHGDRYPWAVIGYDGGCAGLTRALHLFQRELRCVVPGRDGLALSNTWGDRNRDQALNECFMLDEVDIASFLGIDVCQIDDGWQRGITMNSVKAQEAGGGVWEGYYAVDSGFWEVHPGRFPNGLAPLVKRAAEKRIGLGLWFSPDSSNDFANWRRDVDTVCRLQKEFGVNWIKIDGVKSRTRQGEANLRCFFHETLARTAGKLTFDLDVTAEIRPGYFGMPEFGTLFVENRYSDWRRWWPYATFRNLWELSRAVPPVRLRFECLNPERNREKYADDPLAPYHYSMDWIFASVMVSSPLIWCELSGLSEKSRADLKRIMQLWKSFRDELHAGVAYPVGPCPDGTTISGFFTTTPDEAICHLVLLRDLDPEETREIDLPVKLTEYAVSIVAGEGRFEVAGKRRINCTLPEKRSYLWLRLAR
ncbi:MAG: hypothetical protein HPZ91_10920 [Lentisphaeria bacterium]|nr:hypothetical protein [Lentisphaeria bacterium]